MKGIIMKKSLLLCIIFFFLLLAGCGNNQESDGAIILRKDGEVKAEEKKPSEPELIVIKVAHYFPESHPQHIALSNVFQQLVEKGSDGKIRVELYPNGKLGSEKEYIKGLKKGTIEMCIANEALVEDIPTLNNVNLPYIFDDYEEAEYRLNESVGPEIKSELLNLGLRNLGWGLNGFNQISISKERVDNQAMVIATKGNGFSDEVLESMGFDTMTADTSEINMLLNHGIIDGHDFSLLMNYHNQWYKNQERLIITNHTLSSDMYLINDAFYQDLPEDMQALIKGSIAATAKYEIELLVEFEQNIYRTFKDEGVDIEYSDIDAYKQLSYKIEEN